MASDLLALLDTLDGLHGAATSAECWTGSWDSRPYARGGFPWATFAIGPQHGIPADPTTSDADRDAYDRGADARNADVAWVRAIVRDYPRLAAALRTALTPTTDGEREAREALARYDSDPYHGDPQEQDIDVDHLRTALALLAAERAKAADAARERAAIVADLRSRLDNLWALMQDHTASPETIAYYQGARETRAFLADRYESGAHTKVTP